MNGNIDPDAWTINTLPRACNLLAICGKIFGRNGKLWTPRWKR